MNTTETSDNKKNYTDRKSLNYALKIIKKS